MEFTGKKIGIWGFGVVGQSALRFFKSQGITPTIIDAQPFSSMQQDLIQSYQASWYPHDKLDDFLNNHDICIASPGIDINPYRNRSISFISELDIFQSWWKKPYYGITGSVGKTTITHLLSQLLPLSGMRIATGGNIGIGMLDLIEKQNEYDAALLEVSSFQLEHTQFCAPDIALWTNFYPNHLDRHVTSETYFSAKSRLFSHLDKAGQGIIPMSVYPDIIRHIDVDRKFRLLIDKDVDTNEIIKMSTIHTVYHSDQNGIWRIENGISNLICPENLIPAMSFRYNWLAIIAFLDLLSINVTSLFSQPMNLELPHHRVEYVTTIGNNAIYNDSKATVPQSTLMALSNFKGKKVALFIGGISKGIDRSSFIASVASQVSYLYIFGKEADTLIRHVPNGTCRLFSDVSLTTCIDACLTAEDIDVTLFSPAGASFDQFKDYQDRGNFFKNYVTAKKDTL